jgi:hypothetical protein
MIELFFRFSVKMTFLRNNLYLQYCGGPPKNPPIMRNQFYIESLPV